jgi:hypothetical protein
MIRTSSRWTRGFALLAFALTLIAASPASAQSPTSAPDGVLYEVAEAIQFVDASGKPVTDPAHAAYRQAAATLQGWARIGTPPCPTTVRTLKPNAQACLIVAYGTDKLDVRPTSPNLWKGSVLGTYAIVVQDDNAVDGAELVIQTGTFQAQMDLSSRPLGHVSGTFQPCKLTQKCAAQPFTGRFRLPFAIEADTLVENPKIPAAYYLEDDGATAVPVDLMELALGIPTVKLELHFARP